MRGKCLAEYPLAIRIVAHKVVREPGAKIKKYDTAYRLYLTNGETRMFRLRRHAAMEANRIGWWVGPREPT
jgi:hypothetical protein|tara:strand:- start:200 stop:412 length:213 start_codon:yes stop_codon:yes gene_type:complete